MNKLRINGTTDFMGIKLPIIEGGFGEDKKCMLVKDIAEIHSAEIRVINQSINRMLERSRLKQGIHYLDLKQVTGSDVFLDTLKSQNIMSQAQIGNAKNIYVLSERGYSSLIKYMDDDKSWEIHDELINSYFTLREQVKNLVSESDLAILRIVNAENDVEQALAIRQYSSILVKPLEAEIDRYERFLCNELSTLTKSELATKLDTKPQTLAALFKKLEIYTPTSQVHNKFLQKFDNIKMVVETEDTYKDKDGNDRSKKNWQWTGEGSKALVDYLIELDKVIFTENKGFKLVTV